MICPYEAQIPYEPFTGGKGNKIFDATQKVLKSLNHNLKAYKDLYDSEEMTTVTKNPLFIMYPVIVFEGHLFEIRNDFEPRSVTYIQFAKLVQDVNLGQEVYRLIEVVSIEFLEDYLRKIKAEIEAMRKALGAK